MTVDPSKGVPGIPHTPDIDSPEEQERVQAALRRHFPK